jgi:hypothetical protein
MGNATQVFIVAIFANSSFMRFLSSGGPSTLALLPQLKIHRVISSDPDGVN